MGIQNFPAALQPIIQQGFLEREFHDGLQSKLGFRSIADRESFANAIGETITKTRRGLKAAATTALSPSSNTNLDNGLTPTGWTVEQYQLAINQYGDSIDLNMVTSRVGIAAQFLQNAKVNGEQAMRTLDTLARDALYNAYLGGNTRVRTTLGAPAATISVDDIRGFQSVFVNGQLVPVSGTNTLSVTVGADVYTLVGATADGSNVSTAPNGISGTLTFSGNVTVADGTAGNAVQSAVAPVVIRSGARATTAALTTGDKLKMLDVLAGVSQLRDNGVPDIAGAYNYYGDNTQILGLFSDANFQTLYRGAYGSAEYRDGQVFELLGARFIPTNLAPQQTLGGNKIRRGILCGQGALIEGDFEGMGQSDMAGDNALISRVDEVCMVTREPLDRLQQIIAQSWYWIGGFCVPTDTTANTNVIPTASNSYYKRGVVFESL
jgi:hypothetical protein